MAHSLASLTETYTDSDGEDEEDPGHHEAGTVTLTEDSSLSKPPTPVGPVKRKRSNINRLVSYQDETYISSDGDSEPGEDQDEEETAVQNENEISTEASPSKKEQRRPVPTDVELPPEVKGRCSAEHQEKVQKHFDKVRRGMDMNFMVQKRKDFRNPSIYEKLIIYCNINELGSNYPPSVYDPNRWGKDSYYEELAKVQKMDMDIKEKAKKDKAKVEIVMGTARKPPTLLLGPQKASAALAAAAATAASIEEKRKSKWDQVGSMSVLTANVTGTKTTVISAHGPLSKRPKL